MKEKTEGKRETKIEGGKNAGGKGRKIEKKNTSRGKKGTRGNREILNYNTLLPQLSNLHSNNRGLASAGQLLINKKTGE